MCFDHQCITSYDTHLIGSVIVVFFSGFSNGAGTVRAKIDTNEHKLILT